MKRFLREIEWKARALFERVLAFFIRVKKLDPAVQTVFEPRSVLVVRQHNELGDMLISSPMFRAIKEKYPECRVVCVAAKANLPVARGIPYIDEVVHYDSRRALLNPFYFLGMLRKLRKEKFSAAVVPCTVSFSLTSAVIAFLSGAKVKIGGETEDVFYRNGSMFFNVYLKVKKEGRRQVDVNLDYLKPLGIQGVSDKSYAFLTGEAERRTASSWLAENGILREDLLLGVHPGAGKVENRWGPRNFAALVDLVSSQKEIKTLVFYGKGEEALKDELVSALKVKCNVLPPVSLVQAAAFIEKCSLFICNDTGVLHVAAAVGVKTFAVFGRGSPDIWNPPGEGHWSVWDKGGDITKITPEMAYEKIKKEKIVKGY